MDSIFFKNQRQALVLLMYRNILKKSAECFKFDLDLDNFLKHCVRMRIEDYQSEKKIDIIKLSIFQGRELNKILDLILDIDRETAFEHPTLASTEPKKLIDKFTSELIDLAYGQKLKMFTLTGQIFNANKFNIINSEFTLYANLNINSIMFQKYSTKIFIQKFKGVTPIPQFLAEHIESNVLANLAACNNLPKETIELIIAKYKSLL